ncbi:DEAD/DEAH box helicase [Paenibacillus filicis]|uniref:DEAD/DEAH box helicase n=1 Tax=Paenibacillus gyeongsangnamensis TaxID=3388067 RepID=A0ABT4QKN5_9BACL|nr:DEAD/DEAH box helicase [Paenibacillus filicis]MCZ8517409.1 DEAD/DEAH box helicase [Paenibacillus filicis]
MKLTEAFGYHPLLSNWFGRRYGEPTDVQRQAWEAILAGKHALVAAPTGSGKTLAALLPCLNRIMTEKERDPESPAGVKLLYITPLKALNNDIHHHAAAYVQELEQCAAEQGMPWEGLTVGVRTGDTKPGVRAAMLRRPPDVLVTTPESLYLLLTSAKGRRTLRTVTQVIVDEIHDLAGDRRGSHLSVTLERLAAWTGGLLQRIGVSATQNPIAEVARFLGGWSSEAPDSPARPVAVIESRMDKRIRLGVTMPYGGFITADRQEAVWGPLTEQILERMEGARSVLVFVNNRRLCERLTLRLNERAGYEIARSHHGSVAREQRLEVERALKAGELRCLVATASLELGIDVGSIDLVLQIDSPKSAAAGIQRIGRAGHAVGGESRGLIIARSRGQLPECAVLAKRIATRSIEPILIPRHELGVLCQQIVAMAASGDWTLPELQAVFQRSYAYRGLSSERFIAVLEVLSGYYPFVRPLIDWDRDAERVAARSNTMMAAIMGAGTIPQSSAYPVHHAESRIHLGELDEEYIHESRVGDVFQLGTSSWKIQSIGSDRVYVVETGNTFSEIPFWRGEGQGRTMESSLEIGGFLAEIESRMGSRSGAEMTDWFMSEYLLDAVASDQIASLLHAQKAVSAVPTDRRIVMEQFQDDQKQHHVVIHCWYGRTFNRTWLLAIQRQLEAKLPYRFYANAKDNGIELVFPGGEAGASDYIELIRGVRSANVETLLLESVPGSLMFGAAFRQLAETSLLLSRSFTRRPAWQRRLRSQELLREALPYAERFPFIAEAMRLCLNEELNAPQVKRVLREMESGAIETVVLRNAFPSPFAALYLADYVQTQLYESDAVGTDIQQQLIGLNRAAAGRIFGGSARQEEAEVKPERSVRTAEELYRLLKEQGDLSEAELAALPGGERVAPLLQTLASEGRIAQVPLAGTSRWICADELAAYGRLQEDRKAGEVEDARVLILGRFTSGRLYVTADELAQRYALEPGMARGFLRREEARGKLEPAPDAEGRERWLNRALAERRARQTAGALRGNRDAVEPAVYLGRLLQLQHAVPGERLSGPDGLLRVIGVLQGTFLPLSQWESQVFPIRLTDYRKETLDGLCAEGEVVWIGRKAPEEKEGRVAFFLAESKELLRPFLSGQPAQRHTGLLELLSAKGASFLTALSRDSGRAPSEVLADLLELAWDGRVSNDQFAPLRLHGSGKRPAAPKQGRPGRAGFQSGLGRWYALEPESAAPSEDGAALASSVMAWAKQLLNGYGLLTKDIASQMLPWSWDAVYGALKQLEAWGVLTRGLWVRDIGALQFAQKETVERLRETDRSGLTGVTVLPSLDPANPYGLSVRWPAAEGIAFARKAGNYLLVKDGCWLLWMENNGKRLYTMPDWEKRPLRAGELEELLRTGLRHILSLSGGRKVVVEAWNKQPVIGSAAEEALRELGAEADRGSLVLWPSALK